MLRYNVQTHSTGSREKREKRNAVTFFFFLSPLGYKNAMVPCPSMLPRFKRPRDRALRKSHEIDLVWRLGCPEWIRKSQLTAREQNIKDEHESKVLALLNTDKIIRKTPSIVFTREDLLPRGFFFSSRVIKTSLCKELKIDAIAWYAARGFYHFTQNLALGKFSSTLPWKRGSEGWGWGAGGSFLALVPVTGAT